MGDLVQPPAARGHAEGRPQVDDSATSQLIASHLLHTFERRAVSNILSYTLRSFKDLYFSIMK
jgi:hypothetical protein